MSYQVISEILGFKDTKNVTIEPIDELFFKMNDTNDANISFILVNPYLLRDYDFEIEEDIKDLLNINENSNISIYNILLIQKPIEKSTINFLAPILVNNDNNTLAQIILEPKKNPDYGMAERIESFKENN